MLLRFAFVSSNFSQSGANSFVVAFNNDEVHYWGPETSGKWEIDFYNYIPSRKTGYFNTLGQFIATQEWGLEVYFNPGGAGSVQMQAEQVPHHLLIFLIPGH